MKPQFWTGKRVFLTGHTGFKGSWLAQLLVKMGASVRGFALLPPTDPSLFELAGVADLVESVIGDIRDRAALERALQPFAPDVVLHFAAQSVVLSSYDDPIETFSTNVIGTAQVLDAVRRLAGRCAVVNVTTDKVYENRGWVWGYRESDALGGRDPYSASKACAELVAQSYRHSFFQSGGLDTNAIGLASARAGNVIGGGDWTPRQLVPEAIDAFSAGQPVVLRHPQAIRPWQHVLDCLSGYLTLAEALYEDPARYSDEWNFGPTDDDTLTVSQVVERLAGHWGARQAWVQDTGRHAHEEMELRLNSQKAERMLGWRRHLPLDEALEWTARWYRRQGEGVAARALCDEQIDSYLDRMR